MIEFSPKHILCAVDSDVAAPLVPQWASLFAEKYQSQVRILHSYWTEWPRYFTPAQDAEFAKQIEQRKAAVGKDLQRLTSDALTARIPYEVAVIEAPAVQAISEEIAKKQPDLIIMGSHGRSGLKRVRLGSVAETVLYESTVPVLIVKGSGSDSPPPQIRRVLAPVNFTAFDRECTEMAASLASAFTAKLFVLHAQEQSSCELSQVRKVLCQWISRETRSNCDVVEVVRKGNAAEEILLHAQEEDIDLIVLGAEHRPFLEITTWGTTTERVIRHSSKSVLAMPWRRK
jgi:nucleotide-binding universal stress UspA family protein